jgi:hypothetical protein
MLFLLAPFLLLLLAGFASHEGHDLLQEPSLLCWLAPRGLAAPQARRRRLSTTHPCPCIFPSCCWRRTSSSSSSSSSRVGALALALCLCCCCWLVHACYGSIKHRTHCIDLVIQALQVLLLFLLLLLLRLGAWRARWRGCHQQSMHALCCRCSCCSRTRPVVENSGGTTHI